MPIHDSRQPVLIPEAPPKPGLDDSNRLPRVRRKLAAILAEIEDAAVMPWDESERGRCTILVRNMTGWLPDEEAADIRHRFAAALARLDRSAP